MRCAERIGSRTWGRNESRIGSGTVLRAAMAFAIAWVCLGGAAALGQETMSPAELRRELVEQRSRAERAEREVARLTREKEELEQRVAELESRVAELVEEVSALEEAAGPRRVQPSRVTEPNPGGASGGGQATGDGQPGQGGSSGRVPTNPLGSPSSLFFAMQLSYEDAIEEATDAGETLSAREQQRVAERWVRRVRGDIRGTAEWLVRLSPAPTPSDPSGETGRTAMLRVIDPSNMGTIGSPIRVVVPRRYRDEARETDADQLWDLRVRLSASPVYNPERERAGPFNFPLLIGPYAEFGFDLDWQSLREVTPEELAERRGGSSPE